MTEYYIPTQAGEAELVEKRSRFIGHVWRVESEEEARARIEEMKKRYYDARHNCWCYLLREGPVRYSDDGEPQGTAGQPMLNVFQREEVTNVCCVVTRYFGGILLGAGAGPGLYSKRQGCPGRRRHLGGAPLGGDAGALSIQPLERLKSETAAWGGVIPETEYGADVTLTVLLPEEKAEAYLAHILDMTAGTVEGIATGERFQDVPWRSAGGAGGPG